MTSGDKMQLASHIPAAMYNLTQSLKPINKQLPSVNNQAGRALSSLDSLKVDMQPIINDTNLGFNADRRALANQTTGGSFAANLSNLSTNRDRVLANTRLQGDQLNNQYKSQAAMARMSLGEQDRMATERANNTNLASEATRQHFGAAAFSGIGEGLNQTGQAMNAGKLNETIANLAQTKNMYYNSSTGTIDYKKMAQESAIKYPQLLNQFQTTEALEAWLKTIII